MELKCGERVRIEPFAEEGEVFMFQEEGDQVVLGVIFYPSQRAEKFVLSREELAQRVRRIPAFWEDFPSKAIHRDLFLLFTETLRMRLAYTFDPHYAVSVTQVDLLPHQVDAVYNYILPLPRIRFLLADDPGLGKTIMAGLVLKELKARKVVNRTLLVVPAHLQDQWQREMSDWFRENFVPLRRELLHSLYSPDFFDNNPQVLVSMDLARKDEFRDLLARQTWDLVIVDEAHKLYATRYRQKVYKTKRYQLGEALAPKTTHFLFLTATPHKGDDYAYFMLLSLLEPRLFANPEQLKGAARSGKLPFVLRRTKEQVTDLQGRPLFRKREVKTLSVHLTEAEKRLYEAVTAYVRRWYAAISGKTDRRSRNVALALTILQRRLSSSLFAVQESLRRRKSKLKNLREEWERRLSEDLLEWDEETLQDLAEMSAREWESFQERLEGLTAARNLEELEEELRELDELIRLAQEAEKEGEEAKVRELRRVVEQYLRQHPDEKLLVFTEFKDTLTALERRMYEWGFPCAIIHGQMSLQARIDEERHFRDEVQVMVATDAAGEGLNLQFCRFMVNYDLPWNPNRLEQRMGRIHRYGQKRDCFIFNMLYPETCEGRVLQRLMEKLELMRQRLGDTVYDVIGTLLEGIPLEELIMQSILKGEEEPELERVLVNIEERLENLRCTLEENALAGHHIDLSAVQKNETNSILRRLVPWDVERFTRLAVRLIGGQLVEDRRYPNVFRIIVPKEFLKQHNLRNETFARGLRIAFERNIAYQANAEFFAPGHPLLEALIDHFWREERPVRAILVDEKMRRGILYLYRARIQDGQQKPVLERLIALFYDQITGEAREVDPRIVWELEPLPEGVPIPENLSDLLSKASLSIHQRLLESLKAVKQEAEKRREREVSIKKQWLEASYKELIRESNAKLIAYSQRQEAGEDMSAAIRQEEENLKTLRWEQVERLSELEKEQKITMLEPNLEAIALILPKVAEISAARPEDEAAKLRVEQAGIRVAMEYERAQGREPKDVSREYPGYDILSSSPTETRYIEVKAFATTGTVEMTSHEWQMAKRLQDAYWLYIVENALTKPNLHTIQNPAARLKPQPVTGVIKVIVEGWKETA